MTRESFARVKAILVEVRQLPAEARAASLDALCEGDEDLRAEVESLLAHDGDAGNPVLEGGVRVPEAAPQVLPKTIGPYEILGTLGRGGMGVVYRARQPAPLQGEVAIKVVRGGLDTEALVARFEAERRALAVLDHPNIARVLDAGADERGSPFFVMELVSGPRITEYADDEHLSVRERVELMLPVCAAVQHAHRKGIIHRDLKPSNLLVATRDGEPVPKVIDFGIAKLTEREDGATLFTQAGQIVGTPEYMSPEQAGVGSAALDTRSDVYSLGVILYELLTGTLPFDPRRLQGLGVSDILEILRTEEPTRASTRIRQTDNAVEVTTRRRTTPRALERELRGDLDWILVRALERDPDLRYATPEEFADDLSRLLRNQPVDAGPPGSAVRLRKFVRRNRRLVITASAAFVMLLAGIASTSWQAVRARRAERQAVSELEVSDAVTLFLTRMLVEANPDVNPEGREVTVREAIDSAAADLDDASLPPRVRFRIALAIGSTYRAHGQYEDATTFLTTALEGAREATEDPLFIAELAAELAAVQWDMGHLEEAEALFVEALEIRRDFLAPSSGWVGEALNGIGAIRLSQGRYDEAESLFLEALEIRRVGDFGSTVAESLSNLSTLYQRIGDMPQAIELATEALRRFREIRPADDSPDHPRVVTAISNLAVLLKQSGRLDEAEPLYREVLTSREHAYGPQHPYVAVACNNLGRLLQARDDYEGADTLLRRALEIRRSVFGPQSLETGDTIWSLGALDLDRERWAKAEEQLLAAHEIYEQTAGADHPRAAMALRYLGLARDRSGRSEAAVEPLRDALRIYGERLPAGHEKIVATGIDLGRCLLNANRGDEAEAPLRAAEEAGAAPDSALERELWTELVRLCDHRGLAEEATRYRERLAQAN